jgi:hypothetical protein
MTQKVTFSAFFNTIQFVSKVLTGKTITNIMKHARRGSSKPHNPWVEGSSPSGPKNQNSLLDAGSSSCMWMHFHMIKHTPISNMLGVGGKNWSDSHAGILDFCDRSRWNLLKLITWKWLLPLIFLSCFLCFLPWSVLPFFFPPRPQSWNHPWCHCQEQISVIIGSGRTSTFSKKTAEMGHC